MPTTDTSVLEQIDHSGLEDGDEPRRVPAIHSTFGEDTARARRSDPVTSHEAADHNDTEKSIGLVLSALKSFGPSADHELVQMLGQSGFTPQRLRTARAALVERGLVAESGEYRRTAHNRRAIVWSVTA